jgi:hypothetical protein
MEKKKTVYLRNKDLLAETIASLETGVMSDKLARMLMLLTDRYGKKLNWVNYSYLTDMKAYAMLMLVKTWTSFNPEKSQNAFAFYTQCVYHSFIQYLNSEKRHRDLRDVLLVDSGLSPSFSFQDGYDSEYHADHYEGSHLPTTTADWDPLTSIEIETTDINEFTNS